MPILLLASFIGVPLVEIAIFVQVGEALGLWWTLALVVLTAVIGTALMRRQGLETLRRARTAFARGEMPVAEILDGLFLLVGGVLLLTPGFITDALGFALLIPATRALFRTALLARVVRSGRFTTSGESSARRSTIDATYDVIDPEPPSGDEPKLPHRGP
jgi:UPF0716 protein FxsA